MQFRWPVLYLTSHLHPVSRLRTHISITRKCGEMRTWEQERVYRDVPVWIWNQLENSFSKESGYRFFFVKQREFFINFTATTHVVGPFSHLLYTTTFRRMEIFFFFSCKANGRIIFWTLWEERISNTIIAVYHHHQSVSDLPTYTPFLKSGGAASFKMAVGNRCLRLYLYESFYF